MKSVADNRGQRGGSVDAIASRRTRLVEMPVATRSLDLLFDDIGPSACGRLLDASEQTLESLAGRVMWSVNSTARGGGVAELVRTTLPYWRGAGVDARWVVMRGPAAFFALTKRLHNMLHGQAWTLTSADLSLFEQVAIAAGAHARRLVSPGDVVVLHDPQTAGLVPLLKDAGGTVIWRCHIGADRSSAPVEEAWSFLRPFVARADLQVFTRSSYVPVVLDPARVRVLPPAIDPCSPKNQALSAGTAAAILSHCGLIAPVGEGSSPAGVRVPLRWRGEALVRRRCSVLRQQARRRADEKIVLALSRWDRLKDQLGIMRAFVEHVEEPRTRLILAGPTPAAVADDPEGLAVLRAVRSGWESLPAPQRRRVDVAVLPMTELDENALIVNALQRRAAVVVKKSIQEGFGLGVTEALWKARPVVATRVGGHQDQIEHGETGFLVDDPLDLRAFGGAIDRALAEGPVALRGLGAAGRERVRERYLADSHFVHWAEVLQGAAA
jgi:trehalose synthase